MSHWQSCLSLPSPCRAACSYSFIYVFSPPVLNTHNAPFPYPATLFIHSPPLSLIPRTPLCSFFPMVPIYSHTHITSSLAALAVGRTGVLARRRATFARRLRGWKAPVQVGSSSGGALFLFLHSHYLLLPPPSPPLFSSVRAFLLSFDPLFPFCHFSFAALPVPSRCLFSGSHIVFLLRPSHLRLLLTSIAALPSLSLVPLPAASPQGIF